jgi:hypothetical protein
MDFVNNIFYVTQRCFGGQGGDPFHPVLTANKIRNSSGNTIIWRPASGAEPTNYADAFDVPPGCTVQQGSGGTDLWNSRRATWLTEHPNVRRFSGISVARPFGGTKNLSD